MFGMLAATCLPAIGLPGPWEMMILLLIVVLLFGPGKLKGLGPALGSSIRGFKDAMNSDPTEDDKASGTASASAKEIDGTPEASVEKVTDAEEA